MHGDEVAELGLRAINLSLQGVLTLCFALLACKERPPPPPTAEERAQHAEGLYLQATSLVMQGEYEKAEAAFEEMKGLAPEDPRLPAAMGELFLAQGRLRDALPHFEKAAEQDSKRGTNWSRVGFIRAQLGEDGAAREALERALSLNPRDFNALEALGELELKAGRVDAAVERLERAGDASPNETLASSHYLRAAKVLTEHGREEDAGALLQRAVEKGRADGALRVELGEHHVRARRFDEAAKVLAKAAEVTPDDPSLWEMVGELQVAMGRPDEARVSFERSLKVQERALVHLALARLYRARGESAKAEAALERALESATGEEEREGLELARALASFGRTADALQLYEVLAKEPEREKDVTLQLEVAKVAKGAGRTALVAEACGRAMTAQPTLSRCP